MIREKDQAFISLEDMSLKDTANVLVGLFGDYHLYILSDMYCFTFVKLTLLDN